MESSPTVRLRQTHRRHLAPFGASAWFDELWVHAPGLLLQASLHLHSSRRLSDLSPQHVYVVGQRLGLLVALPRKNSQAVFAHSVEHLS